MQKYSRIGYLIALTDKNQISESIPHADLFSNIDGEDINSIIAFVRELSSKYSISKINIAGEFAIPALEKISKEPYIECVSEINLKDFTDKFYFSNRLKELGLNNLNTKLISHKELSEHLTESKKPFILKPVHGSGGVGVYKINNDAQRARLISSLESPPLRNLIEKKDYLIENIFEGDEYNVYGEMRKGIFNLLSIVKKTTCEDGDSLTWDRSYLIEHRLEFLEELLESIKTITESINFKDGFFGCAVLTSDEKFHILEIVPMLGLDHILLCENPETNLNITRNKNQKRFKALKSIWYEKISKEDQRHLNYFDKNQGKSKIYSMPNKDNFSNEGNAKIRKFLYAESDYEDHIEFLFNNCFLR